jgi:hypothetical protein
MKNFIKRISIIPLMMALLLTCAINVNASGFVSDDYYYGDDGKIHRDSESPQSQPDNPYSKYPSFVNGGGNTIYFVPEDHTAGEHS